MALSLGSITSHKTCPSNPVGIEALSMHQSAQKESGGTHEDAAASPFATVTDYDPVKFCPLTLAPLTFTVLFTGVNVMPLLVGVSTWLPLGTPLMV